MSIQDDSSEHPRSSVDEQEKPASPSWENLDSVSRLDAEAFIADEAQGVLCNDHEWVADRYSCFALFDTESLDEFDLTQLYQALKARNPERDEDILLCIFSPGGRLDVAYQIARICRDFAADHFAVAVPRRAKSAATLIALGADSIHLGPLGQLGPIDPQVGGRPALAIRQALETIASVCQAHADSSPMFADYLKRTIRIEDIGHLERLSESAAQYAERLLSANPGFHGSSQEVAERLVRAYKDHSFVIDSVESGEILGDLVTRTSKELSFAESLYSLYSYANGRLGPEHRLVLAGEVGNRESTFVFAEPDYLPF